MADDMRKEAAKRINKLLIAVVNDKGMYFGICSDDTEV